MFLQFIQQCRKERIQKKKYINTMHLSWLYLQLFLCEVFHAGNAIDRGEEAAEGQFPYLAHIAINEKLESSWCGGAILDATHILTAAHCVTHGLVPINHTLVKVMVGLTKIYRLRSKEFSITKITVHPEYRLPKCPAFIDELLAKNYSWSEVTEYLKAKNDIAVLTMEEPLPMSPNVQKIDHFHQDLLPYGEKCEFAGWGLDNEPGELILELDLIWVQLKVLEDSECAALLLPSSPDDFCARDVDTNAITLLGDSGSPLVCHGFLVGLLSTGTAEFGYPDIFVKVSHYEDFIEGTLKN